MSVTSRRIRALALAAMARALAAQPAPGPAAPPGSAADTAADTVAVPAPPAAPSNVHDTLEIPAARARLRPGDSSAARSALELSDADRLAGDLGNLLESVPGLRVERTGGLGDYLGLSLWGSSGRQVNVYVDGQRLDPAAGADHLGDLDPALVRRIEVYRGLSPDFLDGSPIGGSVNIITRAPKMGPGGSLAAAGGSFGERKASLDYRYAAPGGLRLTAGLGHDQARGDFPYYDDGGTEFLPGRDTAGAQRRGAGDLVRRIRANNAHRLDRADLGLSDDWAGGRWSWDGRASDLAKEIPYPGAGAPPPGNDAARASRAFTQRLAWESAGADLDQGLELRGAFTRDRYLDTNGVIGTGSQDEEDRFLDAGLAYRARLSATRNLEVSLLARLSADAWQGQDLAAGAAWPVLWRYGAEAKPAARLRLGPHTLTASLAWLEGLQAYYRDTLYAAFAQPLPRRDRARHWGASAEYQYRLGPEARVYLLASRGYRQPDLAEKFGDRGTVRGNPALRDETSLLGSAGWLWDDPRLSLELRHFQWKAWDAITPALNSQFVVDYNSDDVQVWGEDLRARLRPGGGFTVDAGLGQQTALTVSAPADQDFRLYRFLPGRPLFAAGATVAWARGGWGASLSGDYQGLTFASTSNQPQLYAAYAPEAGGGWRWDARASRRIGPVFMVIECDNLLSARLFDFFGYPLPPRTWTLGARWEF